MLSSINLRGSLALIKNNDEAIARWVSHVISPHVVGVVIISVISLQFSSSPLEVLRWLALLMPLLVVPPLGYLMWLVRRGLLKDIYIPNRRKRITPLVFMMIWLLFLWGLIRYLGAPPTVESLFVITIMLFGILGAITLFWKISFHAGIVSAAVTTAVILGGYSTWPVTLLVPLVGWSRVRLRRHTPRQVLYGSLLGMLITLFAVPWLLLG
ncbi:MAG TPA: phosphatase PAP2 family protein [Anaerolineae bacterium]|jgi:membrane-associated phospholipid phosphatase